MNEQINLMDIIQMVIKRWWVVVLSTCIIGLGAFLISSYCIVPQYTSTGKLLASNTSERIENNANINALNTAARLVSTYIEVFKTDTFLGKVAADSGTSYTVSQLKGMVTYSSLNQTEVLQVEVKCRSKVDAKIIAELILDNAQEEVERIGNGGSITIIDEASTPDKPTSPNTNLNTIIGILLGALLGVLIVFIIEIFDTRIKNEEDLVSRFDLPILGVIPDLQSNVK
jgi:capsular polysaccharide biosynthesis protein